MNGFWQFVFVAAGLFLLGLGGWEAVTQWRLGRDGVRTEGVLVRYDVVRSQASNARRRNVTYAPVISFVDENGVQREFRSKLSGSSRRRPEGSPVRIAYFRGRPDTARMDTVGYRAGVLALCFGVGVLFVVLAFAYG